MTDAKRITPLPEHEARKILENYWYIGQKVCVNDVIVGRVIGFGEKYIPRGGFNHKLAGVYIDYEYLHIAPESGLQPRRFYPFRATEHTLWDIGNLEAWRTYEARKEIGNIYFKIGDLPETPFWEGDMVKLTEHAADPSGWIISGIQHMLTKDPLYQLESTVMRSRYGGGNREYTATVRNLELIKRGNLWKMEHGEPMEFVSIEDEAKFYQSLGMSRNITANGNEVRMEVAINALLKGEADQAKVKVVTSKTGKDFFFALIKYDNEAFGMRMRAHELKRLGFSEAASA